MSSRSFEISRDAQSELQSAFDMLGLIEVQHQGQTYYRLDQALRSLRTTEAEATETLREERVITLPGRTPIRAVSEGCVYALASVGKSKNAERLRAAMDRALSELSGDIERKERRQGKSLAQTDGLENIGLAHGSPLHRLFVAVGSPKV